MTAPERQSAASAARRYFSDHWPMVYGAQEADYQRRIDALAALLDARERPLLEQVAALHRALRRTMRYLGADDENATEQESSRREAMTVLDSTAEAAREHDQRVREQEREACADLADAEPEFDGDPPPEVARYFADAKRAAEHLRASVRATKKSIAAAIRARSQTEGP